ncbi:MAG: glycosyltransferase involved in cell wall biosynthesis [Chitinophagales bacterium]|jgi:glycosyltransferase involved in cell wall biosynthesis
MDNLKIELSVIVLCYKSHDFISEFCHQLLAELKTLQVPFEIILVANFDDDKDPTPVLAKNLETMHPEVHALNQKKKGKMGWDMRMGLQEARGSYLVIIDGDGQMPSSDIPVVYNIIKNNPFDLVKTYRSIRMDGWYRKMLSNWYNRLFNFLYNPSHGFKDVNSKPKIITRQAYLKLQLKSNDWFTDAEIMIQALQLDLKICEIATVFRKNERRASFVSFKTIFEFLFNLLRYKFSK